MDIVALSAIDEGMIDLVGGKAAGLAALIRGGENVPDGFCVTTNVFRRGELPPPGVIEAYRQLGGGPVAVRSSAAAGSAGCELRWAVRDGSRCEWRR